VHASDKQQQEQRACKEHQEDNNRNREDNCVRLRQVGIGPQASYHCLTACRTLVALPCPPPPTLPAAMPCTAHSSSSSSHPIASLLS